MKTIFRAYEKKSLYMGGDGIWISYCCLL